MLNRVKNTIAHIITGIISSNKYLLNKVLTTNRARLVAENMDYPSIINNGYLHIEQALAVTDHFSLKERKGIIVDVGAADGTISLKFEKHFSNADVYCFEPIKGTYETLLSNVKQYSRIRTFNKGLAAKQQQLNINKTHRITSSSLFPITEKIKDSYFAENIHKVGEETIEISTLDQEIPKEQAVHLIKIDVQGYELEVLKGGTETLKRTSVIVLEAQNHELYVGAPKYFELDNFLRNSNFTLYNIVPSLRKNMKLYEWDAIYVNNTLASKENN
jgi:FkbM family methyltransferase